MLVVNGEVNMMALWGVCFLLPLFLYVLKIFLKRKKMEFEKGGFGNIIGIILFMLCLFCMWKDDSITITAKSIYTFVGAVGFGGNLGLYIAEKIGKKNKCNCCS